MIVKIIGKENCMADSDQMIDVYYDMDISQICQHFSKSRNTVDKAVAKLVKDYPDKGYKYKSEETKRITITAEGVEKLAGYFRKEKHEVSTVEMELRYENEKLKAIIEEKEKSQSKIEELYRERLAIELEKSKQTYLLETQSKENQIQQLELQNRNLEIERENLRSKNSDLESENSQLESENHILNEEKEKVEDLQRQLDDYKRKEETYNSKGLFYRLFNKF
ncbi:MAG: hypothetical protein J6E46_08035 [Faecalicoccus sp.]|nr:hypothetical protein [Faecalicoccus sp.]